LSPALLPPIDSNSLYTVLREAANVGDDQDYLIREEARLFLTRAFPPLSQYIIEYRKLLNNERYVLPGDLATFLAGPFQNNFLFRAIESLRREVHGTYPEARDDLVDSLKDFVIAPNHPLVRHMRTYQADGTQQPDTPANADEADCNKSKLSSKFMSPGVFDVCCPHGIVIMAFIMPRFEGPSMAFELIFTRFRKCPLVIIYDNACNLQKYCLRREISFFADTRFWVDRLHWADHTQCGVGYHMGAPTPQDLPVVRTDDGDITVGSINSQVSEQLHSTMMGIRTQMAYMSHDFYLDYLTFYLAKYNAGKISKLGVL
jgi:hypothetical protein